MKMKFTRFTTKFALIIALAVTGYLVGATTVAVTTAITTIAAEEEDCENDKCGLVTPSSITYACVDAPHKETGCDAIYSWWSRRHYCETYGCD